MLCALLTVPLNMLINAISSSELEVSITPNVDSSRVATYEVSSGTKTCQIMATSSALRCELDGLVMGTQYGVDAKACMAGGLCSEAISESAWTLPDG